MVSEKIFGDAMEENDNLLLFGKSLDSPVPATLKCITFRSCDITDKSELQTFIGCLSCGSHCAKFTTNVILFRTSHPPHELFV